MKHGDRHVHKEFLAFERPAEEVAEGESPQERDVAPAA